MKKARLDEFFREFLYTLLFIFALNKFVSLFGYILISYRAFLVTLNCTLLIKYMGIGGAINSIIIIFPCQLMQLLLVAMVFVLFCAINVKLFII